MAMNLITFTKEHEELLFQIPLFRDLPSHIKDSLLEQLDYSVYNISKNEHDLQEPYGTAERAFAGRHIRRFG